MHRFEIRVYKPLHKAATSLLVILLVVSSCGPSWQISNPYDVVDWETHVHYKANFHTHTTNSDGRLNPHTVVDRYHQLGYDILAITDHNEVTWPWTAFAEIKPSSRTLERMDSAPETMPKNREFENRDPVELQMVDIQGNELSNHHHMGSFFNDFNGSRTEEESLVATESNNGITMLYHPGRYNNPIVWYVDLYERHDHLIGLEVYNQADRYPQDRLIWDSILTVTMPDRPVWGYSNDDMHITPHIGRNWNILILPELNSEQVRYGMENGLSYFIYAPEGHDGPAPPAIESVMVNNRRGTIEIIATGYDSIQWISGGVTISEGTTFNLEEVDEEINYVRAVLSGTGGTITGLQPFGIRFL